MKIDKQIRALYKKFADNALSQGNVVYDPKTCELYVVLYDKQIATRVRVKIEAAPVD
jgi:CO dehydrogenase/acetyl-CoA synthase delta subunit